jgi:hypothetical protein
VSVGETWFSKPPQKKAMMGTYGLQDVISRWEREELTTEQAIGQILLLLKELSERLGDLERRFYDSRRERREADPDTP